MLRDAAVFAGDDIGVADGVEQAGLTVVNVTHDGDNRRTCFEVLVAFGFQFGIEVDVEGAEELALLVLRRHDLDLVAELVAQQCERVFVQRLRGRSHFAEVEEHRHQCCGVCLDLVGEVRNGRATAEPDDGVAVAAGYAYATQRRSTHLLQFLPLRTLRLALLATACAALAEGTLGATASAATLAEATAGGSAATGAGSATGTPVRRRTAADPAPPPGRSCTAGCGTLGAVGHHARRGTVSAAHPDVERRGAATRSTAGRGTTGACADGVHRDGVPRAPAAGRGPPGAFAIGTVSARTGHALGARRVVPRTRRLGRPPRPRGMPWEVANGLLPGRGPPGRARGCPVRRSGSGQPELRLGPDGRRAWHRRTVQPERVPQ